MAEFTNISDIYDRGINVTWNLALKPDFCEGKEIPYFVPGVYEIFSTITGGVLVLVGFIGLLQPRLEMLMQIMYAGLSGTGIGTILLHYNRILIFNFADLYPMFFTVSLGIIALFDELVFEFRRPRDAHDKLLDWGRHNLNERTNYCRAFFDSLVYISVMIYLVVGFTLCIFASEFTYDIIGYYFAIPFVCTAFGGMIYLTTYKQYKNVNHANQLRKLRNRTLFTGVLSIIFKVIDSFLCTSTTVWLFPHPLFHIFTTYATHCFIVFIAFYRANNELEDESQEKSPEIYWFLNFYPHIFMPDYSGADAKTSFSGTVAATPMTPERASADVVPETPNIPVNKDKEARSLAASSFNLNQ